MSVDGQKTTDPFSRARNWLRDPIVQPVPEGSALCEFHCRKQQCTMGEWESCDRRLSHAAGELMPASKKFVSPQP